MGSLRAISDSGREPSGLRHEDEREDIFRNHVWAYLAPYKQFQMGRTSESGRSGVCYPLSVANKALPHVANVGLFFRSTFVERGARHSFKKERYYICRVPTSWDKIDAKEDDLSQLGSTRLVNPQLEYLSLHLSLADLPIPGPRAIIQWEIIAGPGYVKNKSYFRVLFKVFKEFNVFLY